MISCNKPWHTHHSCWGQRSCSGLFNYAVIKYGRVKDLSLLWSEQSQHDFYIQSNYIWLNRSHSTPSFTIACTHWFNDNTCVWLVQMCEIVCMWCSSAIVHETSKACFVVWSPVYKSGIPLSWDFPSQSNWSSICGVCLSLRQWGDWFREVPSCLYKI